MEIKAFPLFAVIIALTFLISGTIMCGFLLLACIFVWPFSHHWYRQLSYYLIYPVWSQVVFLIDWWAPSEIEMVMEGDPEQQLGKEHALVLMNHSYDIDFLVGWLICERCKLLAATKVFAKRSLSYMPIIGWIWRMAEIIFLDRNWQKDKNCIGDQISKISEYKNPVWILLFPEGTRFTPKKHRDSVEFAIKNNMKPLENLLIPRTKGFFLTMEAIKKTEKKIGFVYDVTIAFKTGPNLTPPTLMNLIKGRKVKAYLSVSRIPVEKIPVEEKKCEKFLQDIFLRKDFLLKEFFRVGHFTGRPVFLPRRCYTLVNEVFWVSFVLGAIFYYVFWFASPISLTILAILVGGVSIAMHHLADVTVISKGSTYGNTFKVTS